MSVSYIPAPHERPYYEGLFRAADVSGKGILSGAEAVQFFARSKLPVEVLKNIWTVADQPSTSTLDLKKFAVAVRLIQLTQNGQKGQGPTLAVAPGVTLRPAFFEGISGVSVPLPPQIAAGQQQPQPQMPPTPGQLRPAIPQQMTPPTPSSQRPSMPMPPHSSAPPTPMRQIIQPPNSPGGVNRALVAQDPYTMTPQERARYEDLFPQYSKPDGFVYGKEAVDLFSKSGVDQAVLRDIWNMVDRPVDNRLDKLEFAIAMHLIVCISKKNLPPPQGNLPNSLKALKAASSTPPSAQRPPQPAPATPAPAQAVPSRQPAVIPSPPGPQAQMGPHTTVSYDHGQQGPPPVVSTGGLSISDAFEGLSMTSEGPRSPPQNTPLPSYVPQQNHGYSGLGNHQPSVPEDTETTFASPPLVREVPAPTSGPTAHPASSKDLAASYQMGDSNEELIKLKAVLQKLQAENISLKAQMGSMTEEEKDVQKELSAIVAEIGKLSNELHSLRAQVLQAKTRLLEASAELKSSHEKKGVIIDLIQEAQETKIAIEDATAAMKSANVTSHHMERKRNEAIQMTSNFESNLLDFHGGSAPAPAVQLDFSAPPKDTSTGQIFFGSTVMSPPSSSIPVVQTVSSEEQEGDDKGHHDDDSDGEELFSNEYGRPAPVSVPEPALVVEQSQPRISAPPTPQYEQPTVYSRPPSTQSSRPNALGHQPRQSSLGFNPDFIMGGSAEPLPDAAGTGISPAARSKSSSADFGYEDEELFQNVEELKKKAELAAETARDAEAAHQKLLNEADELRADADKAEATARSLKAAAAEKKKGRFGMGGGDKKKLSREYDRAVEDAQDIRKRFLEVQGQARDAGTVATQTRREAEKLREAAEKAELEMVAAASMRDQEKKQDIDRQSVQSSNGYQNQGHASGTFVYGQSTQTFGQPAGLYGQPSTGYGQPTQGYGPPLQGYGPPLQGYGQPPAPQYGQIPAPSMDNGFAAGVMGGGGDRGFDLPSPQALSSTGVPDYSNPFEQ